MSIKGVLLDIDGTLVLSNDAHAQAWVEAFAQFGHQVPFDEAKKLIGMGGDKLMPKLVPGLDKESGFAKEISEFRSQLFLDKYAPNLKPVPGSRALLQKLLAAGLKLMVASSASEKELECLLAAAEVDDLLKEATTSDDADNSKPDPDIVTAALTKIHLSADEVLMIGDTPYDIQAANDAGVSLIAVRCGGWTDKDLVGARAIYDNPADLLAQFNESPLGKL